MRPGRKASPETRARMSAAWDAPGRREQQSAANKAYWTLERREEARQRAKREAKDPMWQAKVRVGTAAAMADSETKARQVAGIRKAMAKPEVREKIARRTREAMADPAIRERIVAGLALAREHPDRAARAADGIRRTFELDHIAVELRALIDAWRAARPEVRNQFLASLELFEPLFATPEFGCEA